MTRANTENIKPGPAPKQPARDAAGGEQQLQCATLQELRQPVGRVEEVERIARGRSVEHDHVPIAAAVQLEQLCDSRELL